MRSVSVDELRPGMILARTIVNDDLVVILSEDTLLEDRHIKRLQSLNIPFAHIKDEYELSSNYLSVSALFSPSNAFISEYKEVVHVAQEIFSVAEKEGKPPVYDTQCLVHNSLLPLSRQSGVIDYIFELNHLASDIYNHSLRVAILSGVIAKWLEFGAAKVQDIILAGFLHDIGKTKLSPELLSVRPHRMNAEDHAKYLQHTVEGADILAQCSELSEGVRQAARQHHEYMDGSGGPLKISGDAINEYARIVGLADFYDYLTTEVEGEVKNSPFDAIELIKQDMNVKFDPHICIPFLMHIKMSFLGSRVMLSNGMVGTIVRYSNYIDSQPLIRINEATIIDLNEYKNLSIIEYNPKG